MATPFDSVPIRDWFFDAIDPPAELTSLEQRISVDGSGPFACDEFIAFVRSHDLDAVRLDGPNDEQANEILVLGRFDFEPHNIIWLLEMREGARLRIYSQEMFLLYWASGADPFEFPELLGEIQSDHEGLSSLPELEPNFIWPSTYAPEPLWSDEPEPSGDEFFDAASPGLLAVCGYRTGKSAQADVGRRIILIRIFESPSLSTDFPTHRIGLSEPQVPRYLHQWGAARSARRLQKTAETIAALCRNEKRRNYEGRLDVSIGHRESDLAWLKANYYDPMFASGSYRWPDTDV